MSLNKTVCRLTVSACLIFVGTDWISFAGAGSAPDPLTGPTVQVYFSGLGDKTSISPIKFKIKFTQPVYGFSTADVHVINGTKGTLIGSNGGTDYEIPVTPTVQGDVTCWVPAGSAVNASNEINTNLSLAKVTYDSTPPVATVYPGVPPLTNTKPVTFWIHFSEPVLVFGKEGLTITGGTVQGNFSWYSTMKGFSVDVAPPPLSDDVVITCKVKANATSDEAGNKNAASNTASKKFDAKKPNVSVSPALTATNTSPILFTVVFTEPVNGLTLDGFLVTNGAPTSLSADPNKKEYSLQVSPTTEGGVTVQVKADTATDDAGNYNSASAVAEATYDKTPPEVAVTSPTLLTNTTSIPFLISFSEEVTGLTGDGFEITNGTLETIAGNGKEYSISVTPASDGEVTISLKPGAANDAAGNPSLPSNTVSVSYDSTAPQPPSALTAIALSTSSVKLTWTVSADSATFVLERMKPEGTYEEIATVSALDHLDTGLVADTLYSYRVRAHDAAGNSSDTASTQIRTSILTELAYGDGEGVWGWGADNPEDPFNTSRADARAQFVILAAELKAAGLDTDDSITEIRFQYSQASGLGNVPLLYVRMKHTTQTVSTAFDSSGWTPVFVGTEVAGTAGQWVILALQSAFSWNGVDHLLVDVARDGTSFAPGGGIFVRTGLSLKHRMYAGYGDNSSDWPFDTWLIEEQQYTLPKLHLAYNPAPEVALAGTVSEQGNGESSGGGGGCGLVGFDALLLLAILTLWRRRKEATQ